MLYKVGKMTFQSEIELPSFKQFVCESKDKPDVVLNKTENSPSPGKDRQSGLLFHRKIPEGWFIHYGKPENAGLFVSEDYTQLHMFCTNEGRTIYRAEWLVRIALECWLARQGFVSLHSAAIEIDNVAYAFSGPSGIGKSTRAAAWKDALGASLINGDRPLIDVNNMDLYGVPWDGKEMCFRNVHYPLKAICEVRRSDSVYIREMSFVQRRKLLMRQCFIPMWDNETAAILMTNITKLAVEGEMVRAFSGPIQEDARALYSALQEHHYLKEEPDMKAKSGFVLRNVVDEYILMPTGDNIGQFNGTVLLNEVSAFVWEKLQNPLSRDDLLKAILDEFEVDRATASADLDVLIKTLRGYGVIEDD